MKKLFLLLSVVALLSLGGCQKEHAGNVLFLLTELNSEKLADLGYSSYTVYVNGNEIGAKSVHNYADIYTNCGNPNLITHTHTWEGGKKDWTEIIRYSIYSNTNVLIQDGEVELLDEGFCASVHISAF